MSPRPENKLGWPKTVAVGVGGLWISLATWSWSYNFTNPLFTDYLSYWAAGKFALMGDAPNAWDIQKHRALELTVVSFKALMPFPYPPPYLFVVTPFSVLNYVWGFAAWFAANCIFYFFATRRSVETAYSFSHPSVFWNGLIGQNGLLTAGIFTLGTGLLITQPFLAGAILGALVIKPQLALLLPVAAIASKNWRAIAGAALSGGTLLLLSLLAFGWPAFEGFFRILPVYTNMMRLDQWPWNQFISTFAFVRYFGVDQSVALTAHAIVALGAVVLTWIAWSREWKERVPILAAATLLIPPYLLTYDALLMIIPMGFWIKEQRGRLAGLLWFLCLLPIAFYFNLYRGPNTVPLAALVFLGVCLADRLRDRSRVAANVDHAHLV